MDKGETATTIISLLLLCIAGVFGIPPNAFLLYKAFRKPNVLIRNPSYFILAALGLLACGFIIPAKVVEFINGIATGRVVKSLCTPILSLMSFLELVLMFSLSVLTINRSITVQTLRRRHHVHKESILVVTGIGIGVVGFIYVITSGYDSGTWTENSEICTVNVESTGMSKISAFYIFRFILLIITCMAMLSSWISMLKFLYNPKVVPMLARYKAGTEIPEIHIIFDKQFQTEAEEEIKKDEHETAAVVTDGNIIRGTKDQTSIAEERFNDFISTFSPSFLRRALTALPQIRRGSGIAFSDIISPETEDDDSQSRQFTPVSLPADLHNPRSRVNSMLSSRSAPCQRNKCNRKNSKELTIHGRRLLHQRLSVGSHVIKPVNTSGFALESEFQETSECHHTRCSSMYSLQTAPSKWKKGNRHNSQNVRKSSKILLHSDSLGSMQSIGISSLMHQRVSCHSMGGHIKTSAFGHEVSLESDFFPHQHSCSGNTLLSARYKTHSRRTSSAITSLKHVNDPENEDSRSARTDDPKRCRKQSALNLGVPSCFASQSNLDIEHDSDSSFGTFNARTSVQRFVSTESDMSIDNRFCFTQASVLETLQHIGEGRESPDQQTDPYIEVGHIGLNPDSECNILSFKDESALQVEESRRSPPVEIRITKPSNLSCGMNIQTKRNNVVSDLFLDEQGGDEDTNDKTGIEVLSPTLRSATSPGSVGLDWSNVGRSTSDLATSPGLSTCTEFSFLSRRRNQMKKAAIKPLLEIIIVLFLLLPDSVLKILSFWDTDGSMVTLSPLTESLVLIFFAALPFIYIIRNKKIMEAL